MEEEEIAQEQADLALQTMEAAGLEFRQVWVHYFSLGGEAGLLEVDAFLHHAFALPRLQRDILAHAINELVDGTAPPTPAPYASDLDDGDDPTGNEGRPEPE